jgi:peptidoglycan/LPS O-acetylase OafA/YrhL
MNPPRATREHLTALTSLRFFAALLVMLYHGTVGLKGLPPVLQGFFHNGALGVSLFFILSGLVLTYTYYGTPIEARTFFAARFSRIYPVYLLALIVAAPLFFVGFLGTHRDQVFPLFVGKLLFAQSWISWMTNTWNVPSWSLSTEAFFYLLFPILLPALTRLNSRWRWPLIGLLIVAYAFGKPVSDLLSPTLSLSPVRDLALFSAGVLVGISFCQGWRAPKWLLPASAVIVVGMMAGFASIPGGGLVKAAFSLALVGLIGGIASIPASSKSSMNHAVLKRLGEASYALYILHAPLAEIVDTIGGRFNLSMSNPGVVFAYLVFSVVVSLAVYQRVEVPANRWLRSQFASQKWGQVSKRRVVFA